MFDSSYRIFSMYLRLTSNSNFLLRLSIIRPVLNATTFKDRSSITDCAMGIKFVPLPFHVEPHGDFVPHHDTGAVEEPHGDFMINCDKPVEINSADSSGSPPGGGGDESNAFDGQLDTLWVSRTMRDPWIRFELKNQKPVCRVDVAWVHSGSPPKPYHFYIETSMDNINWTKVLLSRVSMAGTSFEQYVVDETDAKYVKITITDSGLGSVLSIAQISEVKIFSYI